MVNGWPPIRIASPCWIPSCASSSGRAIAPRPRSRSCEYGVPPCELDLAVERERRLDAAQLDHPRDRRCPPPAAPSSRSRPPRCAPATGAAARSRSMIAVISGVQLRLVPIETSAAIIARASRTRLPRTFWITERSATIAPTPIATQTKKNSSRRQEARSSRTVMRRTNRISPRPGRWRRPAASGSRRRGRHAARSRRRRAPPAPDRASPARASSCACG